MIFLAHASIINSMRQAFTIIPLLLITTLIWADEMQTAKVLTVKTYDPGRIAYWEGRVPIYDGNPFFDITLALGAKSYLVRYSPVGGYFPLRWKAGSEIKVRVHGKNQFYLINGSDEVPVEMVRGVAAECVLSATPPVHVMAGGQVPCD
jgi:hypothetical protein